MKRLLSLIVLLFLALPLLAEDYATYIYQANPLCPLKITITATDPLPYYQLKFDETIVYRGELGAGETVEMFLSLSDQWYILLVEGDGQYAVDTGLACSEDGSITDEAPSPQVMEKLKPSIDAMKSLLQSLMKTP